MKFEEVLPHLRAGKRIQRKGWDKCVFNPEGFPKRFQKAETYPFGDLRRANIGRRFVKNEKDR